MRVLFKDLRRGAVKVKAENLDDLWYLSQIVLEGDLARGETARRVKDRDGERSSGGERRVITVGIRVEKTEFKTDSGVLRISGVIEDGPEDVVSIGSHHTLGVEPESVVTIVKNAWSKIMLDMLARSVKSTLRPKVLIVALDEGEASVGLLRDSSIQYAELSRNIGGKYDLKGRAQRKREFYAELSFMIGNIAGKENVSRIILAGAGFEKEGFLSYMKESGVELAGRCVIENTGSSGRNAISEVVKRPTLKMVVEEANSAVDIKLVDELLANIGKDSGLAVYGLRDVAAAVNAGAVEVLLVSYGILPRERKAVEGMMKAVEGGRGRTHIINHESEAGVQLDSIGGVAAILRYKLNY